MALTEINPSNASTTDSNITEKFTNKENIRRRLEAVCEAPFLLDILALPDAMIVYVMSFFVDVAVDIDTFLSMQAVCKRFFHLANSNDLWYRSSHILPSGALNLDAFRYVKRKCKGTEGTCYHVYSRKEKREYAIKKARVYPDNEGVPYYMMRELAALKKISNKHICELKIINLHDFKLHLLFPYIEKTLHDYMNPPSGGLGPGKSIKKHQVLSLTYQLLDAVNYCHKRGIVHRNLKPKHLLVIPGEGVDPLDNAQIKLADFALVRIIGHPPKKFTSEVITLWYRPPEILMGLKDYNTAVDIWSIGCIFAEMMEGEPLFRGLCEIDQLFQIFSKMGTPTEEEWQSFFTLPNYQSTLFPQWTESQLYGLIRRASEEQYSLLLSMLRFDPTKRASAQEALAHQYFQGLSVEEDENFATASHLDGLNAARSSSSSSLLDVVHTPKMMSHDWNSEVRPPNLCTKRKDPFDPDGLMYYHPELIRLNKTTLQQNHFLRKLEEDYGIIDSDKRIDPHSRIYVIDRLVEILEDFEEHMSQRTVFFAAGLIDRFVSTLTNTDRNAINPQLLGSTCLHIASKCEDVTYIGLKDLVPAEQAHGDFVLYDGKDILNLEENVLNALNFDLYLPTTIDFVNVYTDCVSELYARRNLTFFANFIAEGSLFWAESMDYSPSLTAAAIVAYSLHCHHSGKIQWSESLEAVTQYNLGQLKPVMKNLYKLHESLRGTMYRTVYERYKKAKLGAVSLWRPLPVAS